ncbi:MAG TPA: hypothetical protein VJR06_02340 [Nitrososphaerales archaeon]|nr:hypothetical protein [Nitrososphaerales archaeon]
MTSKTTTITRIRNADLPRLHKIATRSADAINQLLDEHDAAQQKEAQRELMDR